MTTNELYMADQVERLRGKLEYVECFIEDIAAWSVANISDYDKIKRIREVVYSFHEQKRNEVFERWVILTQQLSRADSQLTLN